MSLALSTNLPEQILINNDFEELFKKLNPTVYRYAFSYMKEKTLAEDVCQEAFIRAYLNLAALREPSKLKAWILKITINLCKDRLRKRQPEECSLEDNEYKISDSQDVFQTYLRLEANRSLKTAITSLPANFRNPIILYYFKGKDTTEIAGILEIPHATVRSRMHRGRKYLKEFLMNTGN